MNVKTHRAYKVAEVIEVDPSWPCFVTHILVCSADDNVADPQADLVFIPNIPQTRFTTLAGHIAYWRDIEWLIVCNHKTTRFELRVND